MRNFKLVVVLDADYQAEAEDDESIRGLVEAFRGQVADFYGKGAGVLTEASGLQRTAYSVNVTTMEPQKTNVVRMLAQGAGAVDELKEARLAIGADPGRPLVEEIFRLMRPKRALIGALRDMAGRFGRWLQESAART